MSSEIDLSQLAKLIKDIKFAMFSTVGEDGSIVARPMVNQEIDADRFDGKLWFFTKKDTAKVHSIERDSHVGLAYSDPDKSRYVSICGRAFISDDKRIMEKLWSPVLKGWFPQGIDDPEITLIGVEIESAEVWDTPPGKIVQAAAFLKSVVTGRPYDGQDNHHHLDLGKAH